MTSIGGYKSLGSSRIKIMVIRKGGVSTEKKNLLVRDIFQNIAKVRSIIRMIAGMIEVSSRRIC